MRITTCLLIGILSFYSMQILAASTEITKGLHQDWIDWKVAPTDNFFTFANGNWQKQNPIPPGYARWGIIQILQKKNQESIRSIIETTAKNPHLKPNSEKQKVVDFYLSGMDEATINETKITPLQPEFDRINNIKNTTDLQKVITHLQMIGVDALFGFNQMQDFKNSSNVIGVAGQGGLGLPDRDYYLNTDQRFQTIRSVYLQHIGNMFKLLGDNADQATLEAKTVMRIETALAQASMPVEQQRNPEAIYHMMDLKQLEKTTPVFSWKQYFKDIGHPEIKRINLAMPNFFQAMNNELTTTPINDWKTYLRWQLVQAYAPYLSDSFVNEEFHMTSVLTGAKSLLPRYMRVLQQEDHALGFAIGKLYVENKFSPESKKAAQEILVNIQRTLKNNLKNVSWMAPETRKAAVKKLNLMEARIGYPSKWRDYSALKIDKGPYVLNVMRAVKFQKQYDLNKIGKPVQKNEWEMTPQTVNAYYDPSLNQLSIPAGILQPPFFSVKASEAMNYGGIGSVMGHEIVHGFDDEGAQFDANGNLHNWWTTDDLKKFQAITQCISNQFSQYVVDGMHVKGKLVTGEATADLGGMTLAYQAFHATQAFKNAKTINGFTPEQQFFISSAQTWAINIHPAESQRLIITNPHPPAMYRVNGTFANMPEFRNAFPMTTDNSPMVNKPLCMIWQ